jgi:hypothetical protein
MGECHAIAELRFRMRQRIAHITEQKKAGRRNAIGMGCNRPIANIDVPIREEFAKVVVGATIT